MYQFLTFTIASALLTVYTIYEMVILTSNPRIIAIFSVVCFFDIIYLFILPSMLKVCKKAFFSIAGGTQLMKNLYAVWSIIVSQLQLHVMLNVFLVCAVNFFFKARNAYLLYTNIFVAIFDMCWVFGGYKGIKIENRKLTKLFLFAIFIQPGFYIFRLVLIWLEKFKKPTITITIIISVSIILRTYLFIYSLIAYQSFGRGLKYRLSPEFISSRNFEVISSQDSINSEKLSSDNFDYQSITTTTDTEENRASPINEQTSLIPKKTKKSSSNASTIEYSSLSSSD
ncbi:hypothetical protein M0813_28278 [Anaeramoeba flamelloides]|uniref:Uncharacterized protein n=1 Tax=Anaeramoeba flamelloides TaxID=1746091 RepID=A0ABQ8XTR8_9EUKA|nr:hypothetical protein M0813_28278 [Anaeramoeba flamelloides]